MVDKKCLTCGKSFQSYNKSAKFCSHKCYWKAKQKEKIKKKCLICGKKFKVLLYRKNSAKFCSYKCCGEALKGKKGKDSRSWKNGSIDKAGYKMIYINGKQIREQKFIMEKYLKRVLKKNELVHHINGNKLDNRIKNLRVMLINEHTKLHWMLKKVEVK